MGQLLLQWRNERKWGGQWEGTQFKAEADQLAHQAIVERLVQISSFPIVSEEDPGREAQKFPEAYWLIDPIDGTASFSQGYPGFVTQIALILRHEPVLAAVYSPVFDLLYSAEKGKGAFKNQERLKLSKKEKPVSLIDNYPEPRGITRALYDKLEIARYFEWGSIGFKICKVAEGSADLFFKDVLVCDWDIAAPKLILEEAGGVCRNSRGGPLELKGAKHPGLIASPSLAIYQQALHAYQQLLKGE